MDLVSIITVCKNSEKTIQKTIESVVAQSYPEIEYLIIDGKSTDGTVDIIKSYIKKYPGIIKLVSEKDEGIYDAMNKGIGMAKGSIIGIINSDDWYENYTVQKVVNAFSSSSAEIIYGMQRNTIDECEDSIFFYHHRNLRDRMINHPTCFIKKEVYERIGVYDTKYKLAADYDFMLRALEKECEFSPIYEILANFRVGGASISQKTLIEVYDIKYQHGLISRKTFLWKKNVIGIQNTLSSFFMKGKK